MEAMVISAVENGVKTKFDRFAVIITEEKDWLRVKIFDNKTSKEIFNEIFFWVKKRMD